MSKSSERPAEGADPRRETTSFSDNQYSVTSPKTYEIATPSPSEEAEDYAFFERCLVEPEPLTDADRAEIARLVELLTPKVEVPRG
jgi:hypothetical protein